jgi:hypothetical protein
LDVRSGGGGKPGYIVVEPSTVDGKKYEWTDDDPRQSQTAIPMAPQWLIDFATGKRTATVFAPGTKGAIKEGGRNTALASLAGTMRRTGMGYEAIKAALLAENRASCNPPLPDGEVEAIAKSVASYNPGDNVAEHRTASEWSGAMAQAGQDSTAVVAIAGSIRNASNLSHVEREKLLKDAAKLAGVSKAVLLRDIPTASRAADTDARLLPLVNVLRSDFAGIVDDAARILSLIPGIYQRSGELVEVVCIPDRKDVAIAPLSQNRLTYLLARASRWRYGDSGDGTPDSQVVSALQDQGYWPGVRPLVGVLRQPVITKDGRLIGGNYCAELMRESVFDPGTFPVFDGSGAEAMAALRNLLREVAFEQPLDEAGAIAGLLTAVMRSVLETSPAFLISAHEKGSGKSYVAKLMMLLAGGATMGRFPREETEVSKLLFAKLIEGAAAICFDNLMRHWDSESVATALTEPEYSDRILGVSKNARVSTACLIVATGNNVKAHGDLARRTVTIRLDPKCENPAGRKFTFDPVVEVQGDRGKWVMTVLKAIQGWFEAGAPKADLPPVGSFGQWSDVVRQVVVHYGLPDPAKCILRNQQEDGDRDDLSRVLENWLEVFGDPMTLADAVRTLETSYPKPGSAAAGLMAVFRELAEERGVVNKRSLGKWFASQAGRIVNGLRLTEVDSCRGGKIWSVVRVAKDK